MQIRSLAILVLVFLMGASGCAGGAWRQALDEDSPAAYYRYLRDHPDSRHGNEARERLEFHQLRSNPTLAGFDHFVARYPDSPLVDELRPLIEQEAFARARLSGAASTYLAFAGRFPDGTLAARAIGNATYLTEGLATAPPEDLAAFATQYPESDFAAEARRSAAAGTERRETTFERVALVLAIDPAVPERARVEAAFRERVEAAYGGTSVELISSPADDAAVLRIEHGEQTVRSAVSDEAFHRPGGLATTRVSLRASLDADPISDRRFQHHIEPRDHVADRSIVFSPTSEVYWQRFFVPVASWDSARARRAAVGLPERSVAVAAGTGRALALGPDGGFRLFDLADPSVPVELAAYERPSDHKTFQGLQVLGQRVVIYGADGIEVVVFSEDGPEVAARFDRGSVGAVAALVPTDDGALVGSSRGLLQIDLARPDVDPVILARGPVHGVALVRGGLVFTDGESVRFSTLDLLGERRVAARIRLGREFAPGTVHSVAGALIVRGAADALVLDPADLRRPKPLMRLPQSDVGTLSDVVELGGVVYLLGTHGLQQLDLAQRSVRQIVDTPAHGRLAVMGRHLVALRDETLQVIDTTPIRAASVLPASDD